MRAELPLEDYDSLSAAQIVRKLPQLTPEQVQKLYRYEKAHKKRKKLLRHFEARIGGSAAATASSGCEDPPPGEERPHKSTRTRTETMARESPPPGEERPQRRVS
jgi:hypothetical protein